MRMIPPIALLAVLVLAAARNEGAGEKSDFTAIKYASKRRGGESVLSLGKAYLKKYPSGRNRDAVLLMMAQNEKSPERALGHCDRILKGAGATPAREKAALLSSEILFILSRWEDLDRETGRWIKGFSTPAVRERLLLYNAISSALKGDIQGADRSIRSLMKRNHDYEILAVSGLIMSHIIRINSGYSGKYINAQSELLMSYAQSEYAPAILMNVGIYFEQKGDYNRAYSAYRDLAGKYPRSPESIEARKKIARLAAKKPRLIRQYLPTQKIVNGAGDLDISPEYDIDDSGKEETYYAVSVGPFPTSREMQEVRRLVIEDHPSVISIRRKSGYTLYIGKEKSSEKALGVKVRLAEEFGINGQIVRVTENNRRKYIYGD